MSAVTTIPVTVSPEAEARVVELGMRSDLEHMLDHAREVIPGLRRLHVTLWVPEDFIDDPRINIHAFHAGSDEMESSIHYAWRDWTITTLSPDVWRHFMFFNDIEDTHEG